MIGGLFYEGSGLGDQLFRYITVRSFAEKKGYELGMCGTFKGDFFLDQPPIVDLPDTFKVWREKETIVDGLDVRSYDPEINFVEDNTIIDGSFEDDKYWRRNLDNISKWLAVEPLGVSSDTCIIGFRGGEYALNPDLFLTKDYWNDAILKMDSIKKDLRFEVHTDDPRLALHVFPEYEVHDNTPLSHSKHSNMGFNWRSARYAKYAIIPNSAFFILPRILKHHEDPMAITTAPRYWARRNTKTWARPACYYPEFHYL